MEIIRQIPLSNGLTVCFVNHSRRYYGEYYNVRVEAVCEVPVSSPDESGRQLGASVTYRRNLSRMGVPSAEVADVVEQLIANFEEHSLSYISGPSFPQRFILSELVKRRKKSVLFESSTGF